MRTEEEDWEMTDEDEEERWDDQRGVEMVYIVIVQSIKMVSGLYDRGRQVGAIGWIMATLLAVLANITGSGYVKANNNRQGGVREGGPSWCAAQASRGGIPPSKREHRAIARLPVATPYRADKDNGTAHRDSREQRG
ncbi:hypothetical protein CNYM01_05481 [Colletotrichum nymphaeae SA-01]|uniref:Uncharacterized protein n=1 Tax=Colletotrichum nymphaeae SA-01 TaxID=1460502 RepID=A0A135SYT1_9PEZI|nr:hypothetical protein CNYM01_05481 [Colletotrichum nymphaeae SA-01]